MKSVESRIIVKMWMEEKNHHTFSNGEIIRLERQYNNFNKRETEPVQAEVISAEFIPKGSIVLLHHNSGHDVNRIFDHSVLSGDEIASDIVYYSVPISDVFLWKEEGSDWMPCEGFAIAERVFEPYKGVIQNIPHKKLKDTLYIKSGEYTGLVVRTLKACDYEIIFRDPTTGQERKIIRCRPNGNEKEGREPEVIAIDNGATEKVKRGELFIGISESDAKTINEHTNERVH